MVSSHDAGKVHHRAVNACLFPLYAARARTSSRSRASARGAPASTPCRERSRRRTARSAAAPRFCHVHVRPLRSSAGRPTRAEIEEAVGGNLCRCTGYRPILAGGRDPPSAPRRRLLRRNPPGRSVALRGGRRRTRRRARREARRRMATDATDATPPARRRVDRDAPVDGARRVRLRRSGLPAGRAASRLRARRGTSAREPIFPPNSNAASRANSSSPARTPPGHRPTTPRAFSR